MRKISFVEIYIKEMVLLNKMVSGNLNSMDQPISTKRFRLNQLSDSSETSCADLYWAKLTFYQN